MIVIMSTGIGEADERVQAVVRKARQYGLKPDLKVEEGTRYNLTQVFLRDGDRVQSCSVADHVFRAMPGVESVQRVTPPRVSVFHDGNGEQHHIALADKKIGLGLATRLVAGPCTVDQHIDRIVEGLVTAFDIKWIRGGCWKPRSSPHSFPGFGEKALDMLFHAAARNKVEVVFTEVIEAGHIEAVRKASSRAHFNGYVVLWVGARTSNPLLLRALGAQTDFPVMLKNSLDAQGVGDLYERAEWVLAGTTCWDDRGRIDKKSSNRQINDRLILCLRGIRQTDPRSPWRFIRNFHWLDVMREQCWAPVAVDPSHCAGTMEKDLVIKSISESLRYSPSLVMVEGGYPEKGFDGFRGHCDVSQMIPMERMGEVVKMIQSYNVDNQRGCVF